MLILNFIICFEPFLSHFTFLYVLHTQPFGRLNLWVWKLSKIYALHLVVPEFLLSQAPTDADKGLCLDTFMTVEVKHKKGQVNPMVELH